MSLTFENKILSFKEIQDLGGEIAALDALGLEGWQLVSVVRDHSQSWEWRKTYYLSRYHPKSHYEHADVSYTLVESH